MAAANQWEVVGKGKKGKTQANPMTKAQKKQFIEKMPRIEPKDPVKEDRTIYDAFNVSEKPPEKNVRPGSGGDAAAKKGSQVSKKKKPEQNGKQVLKPLPFDEALGKIDHSDLESILSQSQLRFPDNQDVWLKDLASYLNIKLEKVREPEAVLKSKKKDYPMSQLTEGCQKVVFGLFKKCSKENLDHLFYHCVQSMITESIKGMSTIGYKVFLQMLAHHEPGIVLQKHLQYLELLKTYKNRPVQCLSILWVLGQCGVTDLRCGLKVWLDLMLPCLGIRSVAAYPVEYIENLFQWHKDIQEAYKEVTMREYFLVLDTIFSPNLAIHADLRKRLQAIYPYIRTIAFGPSPATNLHNYFASYLRRAEVSASSALKQEVLSCLVLCLVTDKQSKSTWCQMYIKHLRQSGVLLQHLLENWDQLSAANRQMLREMLRSFSVTNEELASQGRVSREGFELCNIVTQELLQKANQSHFPWGLLVFFTLSIFGAVVMYDVMTSPNIRASRTVKFMEDHGVLNVIEQACNRITVFSNMVIGWCRQHLPCCFHHLQEIVGPWIRQGYQLSVDFVTYVIHVSHPHRLWAVDKVQQAVQWVYSWSPETWEQCRTWLWLSWDYLKDYTYWIWKHVLHLVSSLQHWLEDHVFTGNLTTDKLQQTAAWGVEQMQHYTVSFFSWCNQILFSGTK